MRLSVRVRSYHVRRDHFLLSLRVHHGRVLLGFPDRRVLKAPHSRSASLYAVLLVYHTSKQGQSLIVCHRHGRPGEFNFELRLCRS